MERDLLDSDGENKAVRSFLMRYSCNDSISVDEMARYMQVCGWPDMLPRFAMLSDGSILTTAGAQQWIRHLFSLEYEAKPNNSQEWAKIDGATAFHLIERHAEDWRETADMMESFAASRNKKEES